MKYFLLLTFLLSPFAVFAGSPLVGSDRDGHGCIGSAGYVWSADIDECIRPWERAPTRIEPLPDTPHASLDRQIARQTQVIQREYQKSVSALISEYAGSDIANELNRYLLDISYEVMTSSGLITVRMTAYTYLGGAHGDTRVFTWNYDREKRRLIPLQGVLSRSDLTRVSKNIETSLARSYSGAGFPLDAGWLREGLDPKNPTNYTNWLLSRDATGKDRAVRFIVGHYQVGPYAIGMPEVEIDLADLSVSNY